SRRLKPPHQSPPRTMHVLSILFVLVSTASVTCIATTTHADVTKVKLDAERLPRHFSSDYQLIKRSLRRHDLDEVAEILPKHEERGGLEKMDDAIAKVDDAVGMTGKINDVMGKTGKLALAAKWQTTLKMVTERAGLVKQLSEKYSMADELSLRTLRELANVDKQRAISPGTFNKNTGGGMRKYIEPFPGIKIAPKKYLEAHVGRGEQVYVNGKDRVLTAAVIGNGDDVLLISSSKKPNDWVIPKGGLDKGEKVQHAALREVIEEAGIQARLKQNLGTFTYKEGDKGYKFVAYSMDEIQRFDDWAESSRYRIVIPTSDAKKLVRGRPWMVEILEAAEKKNKLVKGKSNPKLEHFKLD
ncbi:hypothetical protein, variant 1, partial [Phytophthora nicotianae]